jgi:hypothetical protein
MTRLYEENDGDDTPVEDSESEEEVTNTQLITPISDKITLTCPNTPVKKRYRSVDKKQISNDYILDEDYDEEFFCFNNDSNLICPSLPIGTVYLKAVSQEEYAELDLPTQFSKKPWVCIGKGLYLKRIKSKSVKLFK